MTADPGVLRVDTFFAQFDVDQDQKASWPEACVLNTCMHGWLLESEYLVDAELQIHLDIVPVNVSSFAWSRLCISSSWIEEGVILVNALHMHGMPSIYIACSGSGLRLV